MIVARRCERREGVRRGGGQSTFGRIASRRDRRHPADQDRQDGGQRQGSSAAC